MKGFEIMFREQIINVAPAFGTSIFIYQRNGYFHVDVTGLENKEDGGILSHKWIDSDLELGECLEIEIKEIENPTEPVSIKIAFSDSVPLTDIEYQNMLDEKLEDFYTLEKLLQSEGLL